MPQPQYLLTTLKMAIDLYIASLKALYHKRYWLLLLLLSWIAAHWSISQFLRVCYPAAPVQKEQFLVHLLLAPALIVLTVRWIWQSPKGLASSPIWPYFFMRYLTTFGVFSSYCVSSLLLLRFGLLLRFETVGALGPLGFLIFSLTVMALLLRFLPALVLGATTPLSLWETLHQSWRISEVCWPHLLLITLMLRLTYSLVLAPVQLFRLSFSARTHGLSPPELALSHSYAVEAVKAFSMILMVSMLLQLVLHIIQPTLSPEQASE